MKQKWILEVHEKCKCMHAALHHKAMHLSFIFVYLQAPLIRLTEISSLALFLAPRKCDYTQCFGARRSFIAACYPLRHGHYQRDKLGKRRPSRYLHPKAAFAILMPSLLMFSPSPGWFQTPVYQIHIDLPCWRLKKPWQKSMASTAENRLHLCFPIHHGAALLIHVYKNSLRFKPPINARLAAVYKYRK